MWVWLLSLDRFGNVVYDFKVSDVVEPKIVLFFFFFFFWLNEPKIVLFCNLPLYVIILIWIK